MATSYWNSEALLTRQVGTPSASVHALISVAVDASSARSACSTDFLSYTLSKAALQTATVQLAQALGPKLRVVGVAPGITMVSGDQSSPGFRRAHRMTPLGQSSTPEDIAQAVAYLAEARAVTGTTLYVDGGQHLMPLARDVMFLTE